MPRCSGREPTRDARGRILAAEVFGDIVTADHIVMGAELDKGVGNEKAAVVVLDRATGWIDTYPVPDKSSSQAYTALKDFAGPRGYVRLFHSDGSNELAAAAKDLGWAHSTSTPAVPKGTASLRGRAREGGRTLLEHAGFEAK